MKVVYFGGTKGRREEDGEGRRKTICRKRHLLLLLEAICLLAHVHNVLDSLPANKSAQESGLNREWEREGVWAREWPRVKEKEWIEKESATTEWVKEGSEVCEWEVRWR
jgi:hypothetical protein